MTASKCATCDGLGWRYDPGGTYDCPDCHGTGQAPERPAPKRTCGWCRGNPIGDCLICQAKPSDASTYADDQPAPAPTGDDLAPEHTTNDDLQEDAVEATEDVDADSPNAVDVLREALERPCPVTGEQFFMTIKHPELGWLPTYGGPYDSFGPVMVDDVGALYRWRYCHDRGGWIEQEAVDRLLLSEEQLDDAVQDARRDGYADAVARLRERATLLEGQGLFHAEQDRPLAAQAFWEQASALRRMADDMAREAQVKEQDR